MYLVTLFGPTAPPTSDGASRPRPQEVAWPRNCFCALPDEFPSAFTHSGGAHCFLQ